MNIVDCYYTYLTDTPNTRETYSVTVLFPSGQTNQGSC